MFGRREFLAGAAAVAAKGSVAAAQDMPPGCFEMTVINPEVDSGKRCLFNWEKNHPGAVARYLVEGVSYMPKVSLRAGSPCLVMPSGLAIIVK